MTSSLATVLVGVVGVSKKRFHDSPGLGRRAVRSHFGYKTTASLLIRSGKKMCERVVGLQVFLRSKSNGYANSLTAFLWAPRILAGGACSRPVYPETTCG